ncbi:hypothetical protein Q4247_10310 [Acinetobacter baumannii]
MIKNKFFYLTTSQVDEYGENKLRKDPIYQKYSKTQKFKKMKKIEDKVKKVVEEKVNEDVALTKEITRKSIVYKLHQKIEVLKSILLHQRSKEWRDLYQWLNEFHKKNIEPCLTKDLFVEDVQKYLWGGPDEEELKKQIHFEMIEKIYHIIQYGKAESFTIIRHLLIHPDKVESRIQEIVKTFNQELVKNEAIKNRFVSLIKHFDLHSFICTPDIEKFFLDWWDYSQYLIEEKGNYLNIADLEQEVRNKLNFFPESIEPLNFLPRLHHQHLSFSNGYTYLNELQDTELYLTYDLPVRSQMPIEHIINDYLHGLKYYFSKYAEHNLDYQVRVIELDEFQLEFKKIFHKMIKSIDETDLNSRVVEILYLKWSYGREDTYSPFEFMQELVKFFAKNSDRPIECNFISADKLPSMDDAKIWIKAINKNVIGNDEIYNLYDFSVGSIRKKLGRSLERF